MFESAAAKTLAIIGSIATVTLTIVGGISDGASTAIGTFLVLSFMLFITVFDINCVFIGTCDVWGWIKTVFALLLWIPLLIIAIWSATKKQKSTSDDEKK